MDIVTAGLAGALKVSVVGSVQLLVTVKTKRKTLRSPFTKGRSVVYEFHFFFITIFAGASIFENTGSEEMCAKITNTLF